MLRMMLSVEELESLVVGVLLHVFENHLHTSLPCLLSCPSTSHYYHKAMDPTLHHTIITYFLVALVAASSSTNFLILLNRKCTEPPLQIEVHEIKFPTSHYSHEMGSEQKSCALFYSDDAIYPKLISYRAKLNVFAISSCTGLQIRRTWMRWNCNLIELLIFNFSFILHF
jgi:hypothetical protein